MFQKLTRYLRRICSPLCVVHEFGGKVHVEGKSEWRVVGGKKTRLWRTLISCRGAVNMVSSLVLNTTVSRTVAATGNNILQSTPTPGPNQPTKVAYPRAPRRRRRPAAPAACWKNETSWPAKIDPHCSERVTAMRAHAHRTCCVARGGSRYKKGVQDLAYTEQDVERRTIQ